MLSDMLGSRAIEWARYEKYAIETTDVWSGLAAHRYVGFSLATDAGAAAVNGSLTSHNYFDVLGVRPRLGRFYGEGDVSAAVLSSVLWASRFGSDPAVLGSVIRLDGRPFTVVGAASPSRTPAPYPPWSARPCSRSDSAHGSSAVSAPRASSSP